MYQQYLQYIFWLDKWREDQKNWRHRDTKYPELAVINWSEVTGSIIQRKKSMSNTKKVVFCDVQEDAERLANYLENAEVVDSSIHTSDSDEEIKTTARQLRIADTKYSIAQVESHD